MFLTIKTSKEKRVVMKCDRSREYVNMLNPTDETHQRQTHMRRIGCEFEIVRLSVKGVWAICKISGATTTSLVATWQAMR
jgi:hypothetical protein